MQDKKQKSVHQRVSGKGIFPYQYAFTLLIPLRNIFLSPRTLLCRLELDSRMNVLEIGPGPGYFSVKMAKALTEGQLYLYDIQQEMLDIAKKRLTKRKLNNCQYYLAEGFSFPFEDNKFERVFMVTVLGEVENKELYVKEIFRTVKDNGIVSVSELAGDPDRMSKEEIVKLFNENGFELYKEYKNLWSSTLNFKKSRNNS